MSTSPQKPVLSKGEIRDLEEARALHIEAASRGEKMADLSDQLSPPEIGCLECYCDLCEVCFRGAIKFAVGAVMVFFLFFYFLAFLVYKLFGSLAACFYSRRHCCSNTGPKGSGHNPCGPCLGVLIKLLCYLFFCILGAFAYAFYIFHLGPLWILAAMSPYYHDEYEHRRFSLTLLLEEEEATPVASGRVADQEIGLEQTRGPSPSKSKSKQQGAQEAWREGSDGGNEVMSAEAVEPFQPIPR